MPKRERDGDPSSSLLRLQGCLSAPPLSPVWLGVGKYKCVCVCVTSCRQFPPKHLQLEKDTAFFFCRQRPCCRNKNCGGVNLRLRLHKSSRDRRYTSASRAGEMNSIQPMATIFCLSRASADKGSHKRGAEEDG